MGGGTWSEALQELATCDKRVSPLFGIILCILTRYIYISILRYRGSTFTSIGIFIQHPRCILRVQLLKEIIRMRINLLAQHRIALSRMNTFRTSAVLSHRDIPRYQCPQWSSVKGRAKTSNEEREKGAKSKRGRKGGRASADIARGPAAYAYGSRAEERQ